VEWRWWYRGGGGGGGKGEGRIALTFYDVCEWLELTPRCGQVLVSKQVQEVGPGLVPLGAASHMGMG
jgi:hypothetical protein